jgi:Tfp pilus assembly protein PilF
MTAFMAATPNIYYLTCSTIHARSFTPRIVQRMRLGKTDLLAAALLAGLTFAAFWPVGQCAFINYDDPVYVTGNVEVQQGLSWHNVSWALGATDASNWHPLTWLSHMLDVQMFGMDPSAHHLVSFWIHFANVLLLFLILRIMTGSLWPSALVAALLAVHPLNVESVAWIAERKSVLSTLFWLLTIAAYIYYSVRPGWRRYALVVASFVLALMCKPMVVTLPFVLLLLDYWPLGRYAAQAPGQSAIQSSVRAKAGATAAKSRQKSTDNNLAFACQTPSRLVLEKAPLLILAVAGSVITVIAQKKGGAIGPTETFPLGLRVENAVVSYAIYLEKTFYPAGLSVFYPHPKANIPIWEVAVSALVLLVITALVIAGARRFKYLPVGWFWYLGTMVPVVGLVQVGAQARADRYAYMPLIGIFLIVAWGLVEFASKLHGPTVAALAAAAVIVLTITTRNQISYWNNSLALFEHAVSVTSGNYIAYNNLGEALAQDGKLDEALNDFSKSLEADPHYDQAHHNMGMALVQKGKLDEAVAQFNSAIEINPRFTDAYNKLGAALADQGKFDQAIISFHKVLELNPNYGPAYANLGSVMEKQGNITEALENYYKALRLTASSAMAAQVNYRVGNLLAKQGKQEQAAEYYRQALRLKPDYGAAQQALSNLQKRPD